jgi:hypothetical protein
MYVFIKVNEGFILLNVTFYFTSAIFRKNNSSGLYHPDMYEFYEWQRWIVNLKRISKCVK